MNHKLNTLLETHALVPATLLGRSARLEALTPEDLELLDQRADLRAKGGAADYPGAGLAKPHSGRGLRPAQLRTALEGRPLPRRVRAKLQRVLVNLLGDRVDASALREVLLAQPRTSAGAE